MGTNPGKGGRGAKALRGGRETPEALAGESGPEDRQAAGGRESGLPAFWAAGVSHSIWGKWAQDQLVRLLEAKFWRPPIREPPIKDPSTLLCFQDACFQNCSKW